MPHIAIAGEQQSLDAGARTVLDAAVAADVMFPYGCRAGRCGTCKVRLLSGSVRMDEYSFDALSADERADGLILGCKAHPVTDIELAHLHATDVAGRCVIRRMNGTIERIETLTRDIVGLHVSVSGCPFSFLPGQYVQMYCGGLPPRLYTMASPPEQPMLEFHVRRIPRGRVSTYIAGLLREGDSISLCGPFGSGYRRPASPARPLLMVAFDEGLAPMLAILRALLSEGRTDPVFLYQSIFGTRDPYFSDDLNRLMERNAWLRYVPIVDVQSTPLIRRVMRMEHILTADFGSLRGFQAQIAGPSALATSLRSTIARLGVPSQDVHMVPFYLTRPDRMYGVRSAPASGTKRLNF